MSDKNSAKDSDYISLEDISEKQEAEENDHHDQEMTLNNYSKLIEDNLVIQKENILTWAKEDFAQEENKDNKL
jgi:hypothetical protein